MPTDQPKNRRRWLSFSLRTIFIVVTLLAIFIAYHVNWIRQRREAINQPLGDGLYIRSIDPDDLPDDLFLPPAAPHPYPGASSPWRPPRGPGLLWLFGERGYPDIRIEIGPPVDYDREMPRAEELAVERIRELFPEAVIGCAPQLQPLPFEVDHARLSSLFKPLQRHRHHHRRRRVVAFDQFQMVDRFLALRFDR